MDEDPQWRRVAQYVNERMAELVIDQAELSRRSELSDPTVRGVMRGDPRGNMRAVNRRRLARALGWTPDSIERVLDGQEPVVDVESPFVPPVRASGTPGRDAMVAAADRIEAALTARDRELAELQHEVRELRRELAAVDQRVDRLEARPG